MFNFGQRFLNKNYKIISKFNGTSIRHYCNSNLLTLASRGYFNDIFPDNAHSQITKILTSSPQAVYAGFDPTADSLHIGNLLVIMGLLHCQRAGHNAIALIGGATGQIGDPSGRKTERTKLGQSILENNLQAIEAQIKRIFQNHEEYFWPRDTANDKLRPVHILNNADWYRDMNLVEFIGSFGRNFRMGQMLSRTSVQSRLHHDGGMSFTEFTYQLFQAYDWYHLCANHNCRFQMGGMDQTGNIMTGHEFISRMFHNKPVFGLTLPLVTTEEGDKFGKSAGNAIWLCDDKTSAYALYQFFVRVTDADVERLLKLFTFIPLSEIEDIMVKQKSVPELREAQRRLAKEVTLLVHGPKGLELAENITKTLYSGSVDALSELSEKDVRQTFAAATYNEFLLEPGQTVLDVAMKAKCFLQETDAMRIITAGGFYVNQQRATNIAEVLVPGVHILKNGITLLRVGKKNYTIIKWLT